MDVEEVAEDDFGYPVQRDIEHRIQVVSPAGHIPTTLKKKMNVLDKESQEQLTIEVLRSGS